MKLVAKVTCDLYFVSFSRKKQHDIVDALCCMLVVVLKNLSKSSKFTDRNFLLAAGAVLVQNPVGFSGAPTQVPYTCAS